MSYGDVALSNSYATAIEDEPINLQGLDMQTLVMYTVLKRNSVLEDRVVDQMQKISDKNSQVTVYRRYMEAIKNLKGSDVNNAEIAWEKLPSDLQTFLLSEKGQKMLASADIKLEPDAKNPTKMHSNGDNHFQNLIDSWGVEVDALTNNSQVELIKLQSTMSRSNQAIDFLTNFLHTSHQTAEAICRNM
jgi:hypothetical protein